jgi:hypothetical protein
LKSLIRSVMFSSNWSRTPGEYDMSVLPFMLMVK